MARISELSLEDVRCFRGEQSAAIGRISLLVGPNSSGKSTFLGCYNALACLSNFQDFQGRDLDDWVNYFDLPPYRMGLFKTIARTGKRSFQVGARFDDHMYSGMSFAFEKGRNGEPVERRMEIDSSRNDGDNRKLEVFWQSNGNASDVLNFVTPDFSFRVHESHISFRQISSWMSRNVRRDLLPFHAIEGDLLQYGSVDKVELVRIMNFFRDDLPISDSPLVDVRSPDLSIDRRRTYADDPIPDLRKLNELFGSLGAEVGIWDDVSVRSNKKDGTYEILIKTPGGQRNLIDVGYGVYSLLAIASTFARTKRETAFLLQQPEVHLHPQAQADFAQWMAGTPQTYLIETHSDHFMDRFRICVMQGILEPEDLSIIYFEPAGSGTVMHNISVDKNGNLHDVPKGYRDFFMQEAGSLLGFR